MYSLSLIELHQHFNEFLWPLFRISGFFMSAPVFGARLVPMRVRLILAMAVSLVMYQSIEEIPAIDPISFDAVITILYQIGIGVTMGFLLQLLFHIGAIGGQIIAMQNGLGFAQMMDPINGVNVATLSQFFIISSNLIFLALNGHLFVFKMLMESFTTIPIGPNFFHTERIYDLVVSARWMFQAALLIALPAVVALLAVNIAFGTMARVAPQLNIFAIGFPFTLMLGLVVLYIVFGQFAVQFQQFIENSYDMIAYIIDLP